MNTVPPTDSQDGTEVDPDLLDLPVVTELCGAIPSQRLMVFSDAVHNACHDAIVELRTGSTSAEDTVATAHRIRGMVGTLGLRKLSEIAGKLERSEAWSTDARLSAILEFEATLGPSLAAFQARVKQ